MLKLMHWQNWYEKNLVNHSNSLFTRMGALISLVRFAPRKNAQCGNNHSKNESAGLLKTFPVTQNIKYPLKNFDAVNKLWHNHCPNKACLVKAPLLFIIYSFYAF